MSALRYLAASVLATGLASSAFASDGTVPTAKIRGSEAGRLLVLTVGVEVFQDELWPKLKFAADDAAAVKKGLGRDMEREVVVTSLTNQDATYDHVVTALRHLIRDSRPEDIVVVYMSSHGTLAATDDGDFERVVVMHDTNSDRPLITGLRYTQLMKIMEWTRAKRKLVILATCHGGVGKSRLSPEVERLVKSHKGSALAPLAAVSEGTLVLAAAAKGEAAREDERLGGDVYTHFFLEGLTAYDRNGDGMVTALEAHDYAKERTYVYTGGRQRPTADAELVGDADVPLRGVVRRRGAPVLEAYDEDYAGFQLKVDDGTKGRLPSAFPLAADGKSRVTLFGAGEGKPLATYQVNAEPGDRVTLDDLLAPAPLSFGLSFGRESWRDAKFAALTGAASATVMALTGSYHWHGAQVGLDVRAPNATEASMRAGLTSAVLWRGYGVHAGYDLSPPEWLNWRLGLALTAARETMVLTFKDKMGEALPFTSVATIWGLGATVERDLEQGMGVAVDAGYQVGRHSFGDVGAIDAGRMSFGLRFFVQVGGVGRRL